MSALFARPVGENELPAVYDIENACFRSPWSLSDLENDFYRNPCARYIGLWEDGRMIGYASMWLLMEEAHVASVAVLPDMRRKGAGERLMRALIACAANSGARYMELECRKSNAAAKALYHKLGFLRVGCKKGYYADTGEDADVLALIALPQGDPEADPFLIQEM